MLLTFRHTVKSSSVWILIPQLFHFPSTGAKIRWKLIWLPKSLSCCWLVEVMLRCHMYIHSGAALLWFHIPLRSNARGPLSWWALMSPTSNNNILAVITRTAIPMMMMMAHRDDVNLLNSLSENELFCTPSPWYLMSPTLWKEKGSGHVWRFTGWG